MKHHYHNLNELCRLVPFGQKESRPGGNDTVGGRDKQSKSNIAERGRNVKL